MFRRTIPIALIALITAGACSVNAAAGPSRPAQAICPPETIEDSPPDTVTVETGGPAVEEPPSSDELDSRCDIDPARYYLSYVSPDYSDGAAPSGGVAMPNAVPETESVVDRESGVAIPAPPPAPPEPGPLDDNTFVDAGDSTWVDTASDRESTFALDVDTGSFSVAQQFLSEGYLPEPDSIRPEEWINSFDYGDDPATDAPLAVTVDATTAGPDGTALVRLGVTTEDLDRSERPAANITFVIDTSGSMDIRDRLGMVKASLALLVKHLRTDDTISIVTYGDSASPVLAPTPVEDWRDIVDAIDALQPGGSTNMEAGLLLGYEQARESFEADEINVVVLASDGVANVGVTDADVLTDEITQAGEEGIHLVTVGYGMGNYNDHLMEQLANQGDGFYSYVDTFFEAHRLFVDDLTPTLYVVAQQAKVQVVFDPEVVERYRLIGYENRMLDDEDFRDDTVDAGELGAGHQVSALYEIDVVDGGGVDGGGVDGSGADRAGSDEAIDAGTVRLRWQAPGSDIDDAGAITEIEADIVIADDEASDAVRMAALVAYTAELLRANTVVSERGVTLDDLRDEAAALADDGVEGADVMVDFIDDALDAEAPYPTVTIED